MVLWNKIFFPEDWKSSVVQIYKGKKLPNGVWIL